MADKKISALTASTTPLAGTEVLPIVQGGSTVKVSVANLTAGRTASAAALLVGGPAGAFSSAKVSVLGDATNSPAFISTNGGSNNTKYNAISLSGDNTTYSAKIQLARYAGSYNLGFAFRCYDAFGNEFQAAELDGAGNLTANAGNLVVGTAGKGIDFSANANAPGMTSELLTWYEEGVWTPNVAFSGATSSEGTYTRIGRQVTIRGSLTGAALSFGTTAIVTNGLPFTAASYATGTIADAANTQGGVIAVQGPWIVATTAISVPVASVVFTATYFV